VRRLSSRLSARSLVAVHRGMPCYQPFRYGRWIIIAVSGCGLTRLRYRLRPDPTVMRAVQSAPERLNRLDSFLRSREAR
jgi:hypothetical protein